MEKVGRLAGNVQFKHPRVLLQDGRECIRQPSRKWAVEASGFVSISLLREIQPPALAIVGALQRVAKAQLSNEANAVGRNERQQRKRSGFAQERALLHGIAAHEASSLLYSLHPSLLHVLPLNPTANAAVEHLLTPAGLFRLSAQVYQLS